MYVRGCKSDSLHPACKEFFSGGDRTGWRPSFDREVGEEPWSSVLGLNGWDLVKSSCSARVNVGRRFVIERSQIDLRNLKI